MSTIGHTQTEFVWTCLRIDIVLGNQLAIVSIPGDRLPEIGSRMIRAGGEGRQKEKQERRCRRGRS